MDEVFTGPPENPGPAQVQDPRYMWWVGSHSFTLTESRFNVMCNTRVDPLRPVSVSVLHGLGPSLGPVQFELCGIFSLCVEECLGIKISPACPLASFGPSAPSPTLKRPWTVRSTGARPHFVLRPNYQTVKTVRNEMWLSYWSVYTDVCLFPSRSIY